MVALAIAGTAVASSGLAGQLVTRIGVKPVLVLGMTALTAGLLYFTGISVDGSYLADLLPGFLLLGVGSGFSFVPISIAALSAVASSSAEDSLRNGAVPSQALVDGFSQAFLVGAAIAAIGVLASLTLIRRDELEPDLQPALDDSTALEAV